MRYITLILITLLLLAGVYFYALNLDQMVDRLDLAFSSFDDIPLFIIVFGSLGVGIFWSLLIFLIQEIRLRLKLMQVRSENKKLRKELDMLRMQPLQEIDITNKIKKEKQ
ncbi:MAG: LapA family protein [Candidatus Zixiibacteriota bacterium]